MKFDIEKAGGVLIKDKKLLFVRSKNKDVFYAPGGKLEQGESPVAALIRELKEELNVIVFAENVELLGIFYGNAAGKQDKKLKMHVYVVKLWENDPVATTEIQEIM